MDNINMNEEDKIRLAEYIAELVVSKLSNQYEIYEEEDSEVVMLAELARLTTLLTIYEEEEQYEKCAILKNKIRILNRRLKND
ncbi:MAG: hypothetical protein QGI18_10120 [Candidatus Marinimicrobia bacterium]|jgi:protein-arginine kinase activator protein McsA|nr:hypothetical protein [Candidatus Neomarinimicrobiota bacterium]